MGPHKVAVTFHASFGFVAHADWLPDGQLCASTVNGLRNKVERARPRVNIDFVVVLDSAAKARHGAQIALHATNRKRQK
jgi:hypothetical protein